MHSGLWHEESHHKPGEQHHLHNKVLSERSLLHSSSNTKASRSYVCVHYTVLSECSLLDSSSKTQANRNYICVHYTVLRKNDVLNITKILYFVKTGTIFYTTHSVWILFEFAFFKVNFFIKHIWWMFNLKMLIDLTFIVQVPSFQSCNQFFCAAIFCNLRKKTMLLFHTLIHHVYFSIELSVGVLVCLKWSQTAYL